jgi:hypothetical protein
MVGLRRRRIEPCSIVLARRPRRPRSPARNRGRSWRTAPGGEPRVPRARAGRCRRRSRAPPRHPRARGSAASPEMRRWLRGRRRWCRPVLGGRTVLGSAVPRPCGAGSAGRLPPSTRADLLEPRTSLLPRPRLPAEPSADAQEPGRRAAATTWSLRLRALVRRLRQLRPAVWSGHVPAAAAHRQGLAKRGVHAVRDSCCMGWARDGG